jgi:hypothetical protein
LDAAGVQRCHASDVTCLCGASIACTLCESCGADCQAADPVRCAADALAYACEAYAPITGGTARSGTAGTGAAGTAAGEAAEATNQGGSGGVSVAGTGGNAGSGACSPCNITFGNLIGNCGGPLGGAFLDAGAGRARLSSG